MVQLLSILILSGSTIIVGLVNYVYSPLMLQYLSLGEFGEFSSLVNLSIVLGVFMTAAQMFLTREFSRSTDRPEWIIAYFAFARRWAVGIMGICFVFYVAMIPILRDFFHIDAFLPFVLAGIVFIIGTISVVHTSLLIGTGRFFVFSLFALTAAFSRLAFGLVLVIFGWGVSGALGGMVAANLLVLASMEIYIWRMYPRRPDTSPTVVATLRQHFQEERSRIVASLVSSVFLAVAVGADVILAEHLLPKDLAGSYAAISTLGKTVFFLSNSIETIYYPLLVKEDTLRSGTIFSVIGMFIVTIGIFCTAVWLGGEIFLGVLRPELIPFAGLLSLSGVFFGTFGLTSILLKTLVGRGRYGSNAFVLVTLAFTLIAAFVLVSKTSSPSVLLSLFTANTVVTAGGLSLLLLLSKTRNNIPTTSTVLPIKTKISSDITSRDTSGDFPNTLCHTPNSHMIGELHGENNVYDIPFISIVIPTYQAEPYLDACLRSIRDLEYPQDAYEIIIADGGSTDRTCEIARAHGAIIIDNPQRNADYGRAKGTVLARSRYIVSIDADNIIVGPNWMTEMITPLEEHPELFGVESPLDTTDARLGSLNRYFALLRIADPLARMLVSPPAAIVDVGHYAIVSHQRGDTVLTGANGFVWNRSVLDRYRDTWQERFAESDLVARILRDGDGAYAIPKHISTMHFYANTLGDYRKKRRKIAYKAIERYYQRREVWFVHTNQMRFILSILYLGSGIGPMGEGIYRSLHDRTIVWLWHPVISVLTIWIYLFHTLRQMLRVRSDNTPISNP